MKENNFTIEQLEKIINEAPGCAEFYTPGYAAEYRKTIGQNAYYGFIDNEWMVVSKILSIERINKGFNLSKLQKQLEEMKMQESTQETRMTVKEFLASGRKFHDGDICAHKISNHEVIVGFDVDVIAANKPVTSDVNFYVISAKELQPEFDNTAQQVESLGSAMAMSECDIEDALDNIPVYSKEAKETAYDEGMRNYVKGIAKIIGLNFPANVGYGNLAVEVESSIESLNHNLKRAVKSLEQSGFVDNEGEYWKPPVHPIREQLIWALGYKDCNLSLHGLVQRVCDMRKETNNAEIKNSSEWDGEGLPPIGTECEYRLLEDGINDWFKCSIKYSSEWLCVALCDNGGKVLEQSLDMNEARFRAIPTPEQKQQKIDEQNGEKFYDIQHDIADVNIWETVDIKDKHYWIEFAKKVSFEGKLESI